MHRPCPLVERGHSLHLLVERPGIDHTPSGGKGHRPRPLVERGKITPSGREGAQTTPSGSEVGHRLLPLTERPGAGSAAQMTDAAAAPVLLVWAGPCS